MQPTTQQQNTFIRRVLAEELPADKEREINLRSIFEGWPSERVKAVLLVARLAEYAGRLLERENDA